MSSDEDGGKDKMKGPSNNVYLQQKMPMHQLVYTTKCVLVTLFLTGVLFIIIGSICLTYAGQVQQFQFDYAGAGTCVNPCPASIAAQDNVPTGRCPDADFGGNGRKACQVTFTLNEDFDGPVFFYYTLDNFHQNHRRYVPSISFDQAIGSFGDEVPGVDPVYGFPSCAYAEGYTVNGRMIYYYPCGLIARTVFNDTFALKGPGDMPVDWRSEGISFRSKGDKKYVSKDEDWLRANCYKLGGDDFRVSGFDEATYGTFRGTLNEKTSRYLQNCLLWLMP